MNHKNAEEEEFEKSLNIVIKYIDKLRGDNKIKHYTIDDIKRIIFMFDKEFVNCNSEKFSHYHPAMIDQITKEFISDWLLKNNFR